MELNTEIEQIDRSQGRTEERSGGGVYRDQLSSEQMMQCERQGEQCSRESGGEYA